MDFIHFGRRMEIERLYLEWCEGEGIANKPNSFVVFLMSKGWLNERKIIEDLKDRKDEPNSSEIPNNCEDDEYWKHLFIEVAEGRMSDAGANQAWYEYINHKDEPQTCEECEHWGDTEDGCADRHGCKTEPTISKMEQVETMSCAECKHRPIGAEICEEPCHYEPQTDWHYNEQDATWYPYKHEDEPQTGRSD